VEGALQASNRRETKDLHRTSIIRLVVLFHAFTVKEGFKSWVVGKKVISFWSKSTCKFDPSLLVRRVFFPTTLHIHKCVYMIIRIIGRYLGKGYIRLICPCVNDMEKVQAII
jgi:hypothetical protein